MNPVTPVPVESVRYLPTLPVELPRPCGNLADFELRRMRADSHALAATVAGGPAVEGLREDRQSRRDARDAHLFRRLLDEQLVAAWLRRRHEEPVGLVRIFRSQVRAEDADQLVGLVVERLDVLVGDWPVVAQAVEALPPEVVGAEAQRDASPVVGAAAEHPRSKPAEVAARRIGVGLALDRPSAESGVELSKLLGGDRRAAARGLVVPLQHVGSGDRIPHRPRFEHHDVRTRFGEHLRRHPTPGARADDAHVEDLAVADDLHGDVRFLLGGL
jgi:hypothetical protein